jgi:hypothetical protein
MAEVWKSLKSLVKGGDNYSISNLGNLRNDKNGRIRKHTKHKSGYLTTTLSERSTQYVQRLVALAFIPNPENKPFVNHLDGNKQNNIVGNLEWSTPSENIIHANKTGLQTHPKGEDHHSARLTEKEVIKIKEMLRDGVRGKDIVKQFSITKQMVYYIKNGRSWQHVKVEGFKPTHPYDPRLVSVTSV